MPSTGHGLIGLHERVKAIGGDFHAEAVQDGFVVTAILPLAHQGHAADGMDGPPRLPWVRTGTA